MKFKTTIFIDAEQYLPSKDKIPHGVVLDGRRNTKDSNASQHYIRTRDGAAYLSEGDYIISHDDGTKSFMTKASFESIYKPV